MVDCPLRDAKRVFKVKSAWNANIRFPRRSITQILGKLEWNFPWSQLMWCQFECKKQIQPYESIFFLVAIFSAVIDFCRFLPFHWTLALRKKKEKKLQIWHWESFSRAHKSTSCRAHRRRHSHMTFIVDTGDCVIMWFLCYKYLASPLSSWAQCAFPDRFSVHSR